LNFPDCTAKIIVVRFEDLDGREVETFECLRNRAGTLHGVRELRCAQVGAVADDEGDAGLCERAAAGEQERQYGNRQSE